MFRRIGRIEAGESGAAIGHLLGLLALYDAAVSVQEPDGTARRASSA
jgi:hypothetical protein